MKTLLRITIVLFLLTLVAEGAFAQSADWKIKKTEWTEADEKAYSEFVAAIGAAVEKRECNSFQSCLQHKNNPYRGSDSQKLKVFADCAKLSFVMRGYFAWKNALPFSVSNDLELRTIDGNSGDKRYSKYGNQITSRLAFLPKQEGSTWKFVDAISTLNKTIPKSVYSASFRYHHEGSDIEKLFTDFYPVSIDRQSIRAGTNIYDPNGHVAIVYKVTNDGKIYFIDAHPDNSLTSGLYGTKFVRSNPYHGAGFKNFRPLKLVNSTYNAQLGSYVGGQIIGAKNQNIKDFDLVQFYGTDRRVRSDWGKGPFEIDGQIYNYYDYVRAKMSVGNLKISPTNEVKSLAEDLCQTSQDRAVAVEAGQSISHKPHPERLPFNIYGTSGEWEEFSTPSRDARLKTSFKELRDLVENLVNMYERRDPRLDYNGSNIKADMLATYQQVSKSCLVQYKNSAGKIKNLTLDDVRSRLFRMSFDPYHCIELKWGEADPQELATCQDDANKRAWYNAEKWLRFQIERKYDARMDYSLSELTGPLPGVGVAAPPDVDVVGYLTK